MKITDTLTDRCGIEYTAVEAEADSLLALSRSEQICFPEDPWTQGMIEDTLKNERSKVIAVYNRQLSEIVAYGVIYLSVDEADIANIATLPAYRGNGIGEALLRLMIKTARRSGAKQLFLEVRESNSAAVALYEKVGFIKIGKRRNYYINPREDADVMVLGAMSLT